MPADLALTELLSQVLVAFTIEFDNESEKQLPHRTTNHGATPSSLHAPWLVSMVMWLNCMRFVTEEGVTVAELEAMARTPTNLAGMERWRYVRVAPAPGDNRAKPPRSDWKIYPTVAGETAQQIWRPMGGLIEKRWEKRFGKKAIDELRESLRALVRQFDFVLPDCLPILGFGLFNKAPSAKSAVTEKFRGSEDSPTPLATILSQALLAFALEFESESQFSLPISANVLRVLNENGVRLADLPIQSGVSKESISMAMGILTKARAVMLASDPKRGRGKIARLTPQGRIAQQKYLQLLATIEERWRAQYGEQAILALRNSLAPLVGEPGAKTSPLFAGLEPNPDGWRAAVRRPETLPYFPMVLHRGGYPDGS